jgi:hypothetical protein
MFIDIHDKFHGFLCTTGAPFENRQFQNGRRSRYTFFFEFTKFKKIHFIIFNPLPRCLCRSCALFFATQYPMHMHNMCPCVCAFNEIIYTSLRAVLLSLSLTLHPSLMLHPFTSIIPGMRFRIVSNRLYRILIFFHFIPAAYGRRRRGRSSPRRCICGCAPAVSTVVVVVTVLLLLLPPPP